MAKLLSISIDVTKLDKSRFYEGKKGKYANLDIWIEDEPDQYGKDAGVSESQTKEEREAKVKRNYVGSGKKLYGWEDSVAPTKGGSTVADALDEEVPF